MAALVLKSIEQSLYPSPDVASWPAMQEIPLTTCQKVCHYTGNLFRFVGSVMVFPFALVYSLVGRVISIFTPSAPPKQPIQGSVDAAAFPEHCGFADSLFQTSGLGTRASATPGLDKGSNWDKWLNPQRIEGTEDRNYNKFFTDILTDPAPFIQILRETGATAHRFSLEWSVIEPEKGKYNDRAIQLYTNFINQLKQNGIEPYVTIHHFVCPEWFEQEGGFDRIENVETVKQHALKMMERFPQVTHWMPFNEINVDAFQKATRGVYPPGREGDIAGTGQIMRNLLLAHCSIYKAAKQRWPNHQIGSTHQWLNFGALKDETLAQILGYSLSKITHYACYNFFKTGRFALQVPGKANVQLDISEQDFKQNNGFSDFTGVQFYGYPQLKAGWSGGKEYPGYGTRNYNWGPFGFSFGSSCEEGGRMQSFGPGFNPDSLDDCLTEAADLGKPIVISETGCDARIQKWGERDFKIDQQTQREYFQRITPILSKFRHHLKGFFAWTLVRGHLEWDRGDFPRLGVVDIVKDRNRRIISHHLSPAAEFLRDMYKGRATALLATG